MHVVCGLKTKSREDVTNDKFAISECRCDIGGSQGPVCDKTSGQCLCKPHTTLLQCNRLEHDIFCLVMNNESKYNSQLQYSDETYIVWYFALGLVFKYQYVALYMYLRLIAHN